MTERSDVWQRPGLEMRCEMHDVLERHDKRFVDEQFVLPMREPTACCTRASSSSLANVRQEAGELL
jgi:hypothetical protein